MIAMGPMSRAKLMNVARAVERELEEGRRDWTSRRSHGSLSRPVFGNKVSHRMKVEMAIGLWFVITKTIVIVFLEETVEENPQVVHVECLMLDKTKHTLPTLEIGVTRM